MRLNHRKNESPKGAPRWMVTFSDLVTLILVFFILLFSMSQIDKVKFETIAKSFRDRETKDFYPSIVPLDNPKEINEQDSIKDRDADQDQNTQSLNHLLNEVNQFLDKNGLEDAIVADRTERGVVLILQEQVLFQSGQAEIIENSHEFLDKVGSMLASMPNMVKVEGHTDNRPISNVQFPSNWELSSARASSVIRYLIKEFQIDDHRFVAVGYGETRPIVPNSNKKNLKKNRRVEIIIADPKYSKDDLLKDR